MYFRTYIISLLHGPQIELSDYMFFIVNTFDVPKNKSKFIMLEYLKDKLLLLSNFNVKIGLKELLLLYPIFNKLLD